MLMMVGEATKPLQRSEVSHFQVEAEFGFWSLQCFNLGDGAIENRQPLTEHLHSDSELNTVNIVNTYNANMK